MLLFLFACAEAPTPPADPCAFLAAPAPGPRLEERTRASSPLTVAQLHVEEARLTGDPGFYTLASLALDCAAVRAPDDVDARRLAVHLRIQFHEFAGAETDAAALTALPGANWLDWALLGDARMEQGKLDAAAEAYQKAADLRPGLPVYDRVAWIRWLWGDVPGALQMEQMAAAAGSASDPEPWAWTLTRVGWLHAITGAPSPEIEQALALLPDYPPARFARGRIRMQSGDTQGAAEDFRAVGPTVEAVRALAEIDPTANVETVRSQDPRGYAIWLSDRDPAGAIAILDDELRIRQDAVTHIAHAYAVFRGGGDGTAEARDAVATGIAEPRSLLQAGLVLHDPALIDRALASGPGLLPSERALAAP